MLNVKKWSPTVEKLIVIVVEVDELESVVGGTTRPPLAESSPVNVALRSEANVKIVSSIEFKVVLVVSAAVADLNIIEPPSAVPLPAPPCNIKLPPAPVSAVSPATALPAVIVKVLPVWSDAAVATVNVPAVPAAPTVISPPVTVKSEDVVKVPLVFIETNSVLSRH